MSDAAGASPAPAPNSAPPPSPPPASNGVDHGASEKTYTVTDTRSAGEAIAGLLFDDGPAPSADDKPSGAEEAPDTGADESRPTGTEEDQSSGEQPAEKPAAIEPPRSWTTEEQQAFSKLPPDLQQTIVRRESQQNALLSKQGNEAAEARKAFDGERQAAVALRQEYLQGLHKMMALAAPEAAQLANVDWVAVQQQSPAEYTRLHALREQMRGRLGAIEQEFQQGQAQLGALQQQQLAEVVAKEHQALNEKMPDFGDQVKGAQLRKDLGTYLQDGGFTPQELDKAYDHRLVVLATKAMLYDRQLAASASADAKRNNPPAAVRTPGTSQDTDRGPATRLQSRVNRFGRTNSVRDAGSLISEIL